MTVVIHSLEGREVNGSAHNPSFLLTNRTGGYVSLSNYPISRYQGVFFNERFEMFKVIENIIPIDCPAVDKLVNKFFCVERYRGKVKESFFMPLGFNCLVYELSEKKHIEIDLDKRKAYDSRQFGRHYKVVKEGKKLVITFTKKSDEKEDEVHEKKEYSIYLVISGFDNYEEIGRWYEIFYEFDYKRNSWPHKWHVYKALKLTSDRLVFSFSTSRKKALEQCDMVAGKISSLKKKQKEYVNGFRKKIRNKEIMMANKAASLGLDYLVNNIGNMKGIYAGLYWFFQFWSRDEAVSLKALMLNKKYDLVKEILMRELKEVKKDGRIPNRFPSSDLGSADGIGWVLKRLSDFIEELEKNNLLEKYFSKKELLELKHRIEEIVFSLLKNHTQDELAVNDKKETWMDTEFENDFRDGARIEIQALRLNMYKLINKLCNTLGDGLGCKMAKNHEKDLLEKTRKVFWNGHYLNDGMNDKTIRPNVFIAYYVYPELLEKKEWVTCFENILPKLWDDWGGLSSIDKNSSLYFENSTGEDKKSYHRGDSWYWINNLAAICLHRVNALKFRKYISKIMEANTKEILWGGIVGHHAEVSSSKQQESTVISG
jgi:glycogen debranching enzyme